MKNPKDRKMSYIYYERLFYKLLQKKKWIEKNIICLLIKMKALKRVCEKLFCFLKCQDINSFRFMEVIQLRQAFHI